tara:strand:+ start:501 stop:989 length:489 start_codon:yes stop_codon:yes gene_type:complete
LIPDLESARDYNLKFSHMKNNYDAFLKAKATEWANKIVVDEIVKRMQDNHFSEKIWSNTYLKDVDIRSNRIRLIITSEYTTESGFDVAVAREKGTKDHMIKPRVANVLSWIFQGVRMFSKGHMVKGFKSLKIIKKTTKEKTPELQAKLNDEFEKWMTDIFTR